MPRTTKTTASAPATKSAAKKAPTASATNAAAKKAPAKRGAAKPNATPAEQPQA